MTSDIDFSDSVAAKIMDTVPGLADFEPLTIRLGVQPERIILTAKNEAGELRVSYFANDNDVVSALCKAIGVNPDVTTEINIALTYGEPGEWHISIEAIGYTSGLTELDWAKMFDKTYMQYLLSRLAEVKDKAATPGEKIDTRIVEMYADKIKVQEGIESRFDTI